MADRQVNIPGEFAYINMDDVGREANVPAGPYVNEETAAAPPAGTVIYVTLLGAGTK